MTISGQTLQKSRGLYRHMFLGTSAHRNRERNKQEERKGERER